MRKRKHPILDGIEVVRPFPTESSAAMYKVRPPLMQIEDFLPAAGVMGLTAQPGVGKTWLAMEVARAVGSGSPLLGKLKSHRGGVLFVGADSSIYDYARQWKRLTMMTPDADEVFEPVRFLLQESFLFEDRDEVRRLIQTHRRFEWGETVDGKRQRGFHVIVFDTLSALTNVPENDNTGREQVFRMVRLIAEVTDCAIIVVHHNAAKSEFNDGENFRGGTSQLGRLDSHLNLKPSRKDPYLVEVNYKKFRGIRPKNFAYKMDVNDPLTASLLATTEPVTLEDRLNFDPLGEAIMANVRQHPGIRAVEILTALWPSFSDGVAGPPGTKTVVFATKEKLRNGIHNRLTAMREKGRVKISVNDEGHSVYTVAKDQGESDTTPTTSG